MRRADMTTRLLKAALASLMVAVAPVALSDISGRDGAALAHTSVSGQVVVGGPGVVVGFSYGNPYLYGPVYTYPVADVGPLYYYPAVGVYAPIYAGMVYYPYPQPVYVNLHYHSPVYYHQHAIRGWHPVPYRYGHPVHGNFVRGYNKQHGPGHGHGGRH